MMEDEEDRAKREKAEKEEKALHKLTKLANALKMDVLELQAIEEAAKVAKRDMKLGNKIKEISWRRRGLMKYEIEKIATVLSFQRLIGREFITNLDLRTNMACRDGAIVLSKCLHDSKSLTRLDLSENCLGDEGCAAVATLLHAKSSLVHLVLDTNKISVAGVSALAAVLPSALALRSLGLAHNQLCHAGVRPIAFVSFGPLEVLDLRGNIMDERAARVLADGVVHSEAIAKIDVRENINSREAMSILGRAIRDRTRRFKAKERKEKLAARKAKKPHTAGETLPAMNYYWVEPHELRPLPGTSAVAVAVSKACTIS